MKTKLKAMAILYCISVLLTAAQGVTTYKAYIFIAVLILSGYGMAPLYIKLRTYKRKPKPKVKEVVKPKCFGTSEMFYVRESAQNKCVACKFISECYIRSRETGE